LNVGGTFAKQLAFDETLLRKFKKYKNITISYSEMHPKSAVNKNVLNWLMLHVEK